jgi:hypothetical protein
MIYDFPDTSEPLRQGDIFTNLPKIDVSLQKMVVIDKSGEKVISWNELVGEGEPIPISIVVPAEPVIAIVATQDCDALRSRDVTLCEIRDFLTVEGKCKLTNSPKSWNNIITQHARINQKWFYLPPDSRLGFRKKMAVDFVVTLRIPRHDLEEMRSFRVGRLNEIAEEHFRERISEFFRRYPYDEWYPLDKEELGKYREDHSDIKPYQWQI